MSASFGNLDVNNGLASRLLRAIGYSVSEESSGSMRIGDMLVGIQAAKVTLAPEDLKYLEWLEDEVVQAQVNGKTVFEW